ncbi:MAG: TrkA family potassium uptake protein [Clostridiaceae bacterium]|nr:TrkA family potassium uptake protein [Clostridiaceae bacterium]
MQIIVLGASRAGLALVRRLLELDHDVVLVDPDATSIAKKRGVDVVAVDGVFIDIDVLKEAGVQMADAVCAVSENENQNLMATQIAHELFNVKHVISRVFETESYNLFDEMGYVTLSSPLLTVDAIIGELEDLGKEKVVGFCDQNVLGHHVKFSMIEPDPDLLGSRVRDLEDTDGRHVFGIIRHDHLILALPTTKIEKGDKLVLATQIS